MNGVTGRMGLNQHLRRSIYAIMQQGGVKLSPSEVIMPEPVLVGPQSRQTRGDQRRVRRHPAGRTNLDSELADPATTRSTSTRRPPTAAPPPSRRPSPPASTSTARSRSPTASTSPSNCSPLAEKAGVKNGVVQDKLWLPGMLKLKTLIDLGFFGRIFTVRGEFGYWVFEGDTVPTQRPSWNYRKEDGGGIIIDMLCHWRYVLDNLFGPVKAVSCLGATHIPTRWDEAGKPYDCTADDSAYATFEIAGKDGGIVAHFNSSWGVRVRRDDLLTMQVDGTKGTAVAGLRHCWTQHYGNTPRPVWNPDVDSPLNYFDGWQKVPEQDTFDNAFKIQWELFLRHVVKDEPFRWSLLEGAKGVQLAEKGIESWQKRAWVPDPGPSVGPAVAVPA